MFCHRPRPKRILVYKTGQTDHRLVADIGDYESWFGRVLPDFEQVVHNAFDQPEASLDDVDAVLVTGSPRSLVKPEAWMDAAAELICAAESRGQPVLGVCFGHQLIAHAFGGTVRLNPNGWEVGTVEVTLNAEGARDPLFAGLPAAMAVNQSHQDDVELLGPRTRPLASSALTPHQAIAVGDHVRGVQFHPEMNATVVRRIMRHRSAQLTPDLLRRGEEMEASVARVSDTPLAEAVLRNFAKNFVGRS